MYSILNSRLVILFLCQMLYWSTVIVGISLASILGLHLSPKSIFASLPLALLTVGNILGTLPISLVMQTFGRRVGFIIGAVCGVIGGAIAAYGIYDMSFILFCIGNIFLGFFQASALYYRMAATDAVPAKNSGVAISWVMLGGILAAIFAPSLAVWSKDLLLPHIFLGSYLLVSFLGLMTFLLCLFMSFPVVPTPGKKIGKRSIFLIFKRPIFIVAVSNTAISQAVMMFIMISTPLAMLACGHSINDSAYVIQWHVLGMFIPSFFSGKLIDRFGSVTICHSGAFLLALSGVISISGISLLHFYSSLFVLGIGWNFMYTAGSIMIRSSHSDEEKGPVQGVAELIVSCLTAVAAFSSGALLEFAGWEKVNWGILPLLMTSVVITLCFKKSLEKIH